MSGGDNSDSSIPQQSSDEMSFQIFKSLVGEGQLGRLGRLSLPGRMSVDTPNYFALTSRGTIPHITPDNIAKHTSIPGVYFALEDFLDKKSPAIYDFPGSPSRGSPLHAYTAMQTSTMTVLAARRNPPVASPMGNTDQNINVFTSTGFAKLTPSAYVSAVRKVQPDITIPIVDLQKPSGKLRYDKLARMLGRSDEWLEEQLGALTGAEDTQPRTAIFAPILALERNDQWAYLSRLSEEFVSSIFGLAIYDTEQPDLTEYPSLHNLPRLSLHPVSTPHRILQQISHGIDIFTIPFINDISDAGVALSFQLIPPEQSSTGVLPLGVDMLSKDHQSSLSPLVEGCKCYACTQHHRAFVNHLLNAKEMLGWTLLQIHNHHIIAEFFTAIRAALRDDSNRFGEYVEKFHLTYEPDLPVGTGQRPRARGYHFKSEANAPKINKAPWSKPDDLPDALANSSETLA